MTLYENKNDIEASLVAITVLLQQHQSVHDIARLLGTVKIVLNYIQSELPISSIIM